MSEEKQPELTNIIMLTKNGFWMTRVQETAPPTIRLPVNVPNDSRAFVKNGELVSVREVITFKRHSTCRLAGNKVAMYEEVSRAEFDPTGLLEVPVRGLDKEFDELNKGII